METQPFNPIRLVLVSAMMLLAVLLSGCNKPIQAQANNAAPPAVDVAEIRYQDVTLWEEFTGRVAARETVELRPRVSGYIESIHFQEGQLVAAGQLLFVIDPRPYQARERAAQANLKRARSLVELARSEARRADRLLTQKAMSQEEFDQRLSTLTSAQAHAEAAAAELDSAQLDLGYTQIKSPIDGRISRALITQGNLANADDTLLTSVVSITPMYVYFETDQKTYLQALQASEKIFYRGTEIRIGLAGEEDFPHQGKLDFIDNQLNATTGTLQFRATLENPQGYFKAGQFARVMLPIQRLDNALLVDQKAILTDQDRRFVYTLDPDNRVSRQDVQVGRRVDGLTVIHSGLKYGDTVVVNGLQKIPLPGVEVNPQRGPQQDNEMPLASH